MSCFNKENLFVITIKRNIDKKKNDWLNITKNSRGLNKSFQTHELFSIVNNFIM